MNNCNYRVEDCGFIFCSYKDPRALMFCKDKVRKGMCPFCETKPYSKDKDEMYS